MEIEYNYTKIEIEIEIEKKNIEIEIKLKENCWDYNNKIDFVKLLVEFSLSL